MWSEVTAAMWPDIMLSVNESIEKENNAMSRFHFGNRRKKNLHQIRQKNERNCMRDYLRYCAWLERRPPWWKFWAVRKWKGEEPT